MGVDSDDEFKVTAGGTGGTNVFIAQSINTLPGTPNDGQFEFCRGDEWDLYVPPRV